VISFYSICFSVIKSCTYWNSDTLDAIVEQGNLFYEKLRVDRHLRLPNKLAIYEANVDVAFSLKSHGTLSCTSISSKQDLQSLIEGNVSTNTGFLLWVSSYCINCVFQHLTRGNNYFISAFDENQADHTFEKLSDTFSLIRTVCDIVTMKDSDEVRYQIQFLSCSSQLSNTERQSIIRKHKSISKKRKTANGLREKYVAMEPDIKRLRLQNMNMYNKNMSPNWLKEKYKTMDTDRKKELLSDSAEKYRSMDPKGKQELLSECAEKYRSMDPEKKQKLLHKSKLKSKQFITIWSNQSKQST
jgi:hypothetical protein